MCVYSVYCDLENNSHAFLKFSSSQFDFEKF